MRWVLPWMVWVVGLAGCAEDDLGGDAGPAGYGDLGTPDALVDAMQGAADADHRPLCDLPQVGHGPCCDIRDDDGSSARGICRDGRCANALFSQPSAYCEGS